MIENPKHPYVKMLIESIPVPDPNQKWDTNVSLPSEEELRSQVDTGCRFYPRCPYRMDRCLVKQPPLFKLTAALIRLRVTSMTRLYHPLSPAPEKREKTTPNEAE